MGVNFNFRVGVRFGVGVCVRFGRLVDERVVFIFGVYGRVFVIVSCSFGNGIGFKFGSGVGVRIEFSFELLL